MNLPPLTPGALQGLRVVCWSAAGANAVHLTGLLRRVQTDRRVEQGELDRRGAGVEGEEATGHVQGLWRAWVAAVG